MDKRIVRINELANLAKVRALDPEELAEQKALREEYIAGYRNSLASTLDHMYFVDEKGCKQKLERKQTKDE